MNMEQFLNIIETRLGNIDQTTRDDIINDFKEHFLLAKQSDMTEEKICEILGDPIEIADEYIRELGHIPSESRHYDGPRHEEAPHNNKGNDDHKFEHETKTKKITIDIPEINIPNIDHLSSLINDTVQNALKNVGTEINKAMRDINQTHYNRRSTWQQNTTPYQTNAYGSGNASELQSDITEFDLTSIDRIDIMMYSVDFEINRSDTDKMILNIEDIHNKNNIVFEQHNNTLIITEKVPNIARGLFKLFNQSAGELLIDIPEHFNGSLKVETKQGDISIQEIHPDIFAKTGQGDIHIDNCSDKNRGKSDCTANSGSGDIEVHSCSYNNIKLSTGSGDINIFSSQGILAGSTGSGDIEVENHIGNTKLSTGSGDIDVVHHTGNAHISTGSGDIHLDTDILSEKTKYSTGSGDIDIRTKEISEHVSIGTGSGSISIYTDKLTAPLDMSSGSGDIDFTIKQIFADLSVNSSASNIYGKLGEGYNLQFETKTRGSRHINYNNDASNQYEPHIIRLKTSVGDIEINSI